MLEVYYVWGEATNREKTSDIGPKSDGQQRAHENKEVWVGSPAGAGGLDKSNTYFKWSMQAQKNTTVKS